MSVSPQTLILQPTPQGVEWLTLAQASTRSGMDAGHLRRLAASQWMALGQARMEKVGDTKPVWLVRSDAMPELSRVQTIETLNAIFDREISPLLSDTQRSSLLKKEWAVKGWQEIRGRIDRGQQDIAREQYLARLAAEGLEIGRSTLFNWLNAYEMSGRRGLLDPRWHIDQSAGSSDFAPFLAECETWWLDHNQPSKTRAYEVAKAVAGKQGWAIPDFSIARRHLKSLRKGKVVRGREGEEAFLNQCGGFIRRDYTRIVIDGSERPMQSNDIWCSDHHICDTLVTWRGKFIRPWLTAIEDLRSRKIVGWYFAPEAPTSSNVLLSIRHAILSSGLCIPRIFYADNGKDFDAWFLQGETKQERRKKVESKVVASSQLPAPSDGDTTNYQLPTTNLAWEKHHITIQHDHSLFKGVFGWLDVKVIHAIPYNARGKPVERFFGTYEDQFGKLTRTYCGRNPQEKPEHLYGWRGKPGRLDKGEAPSYEDYVAQATGYIEQLYNADHQHSGHGMEGQTPDQVYAENLVNKRTTTAEAIECLLQKISRPVTVQRDGVLWDYRRYGQGNLALAQHQGEKVLLFADPNDITRVAVRSIDGRKICDAEAEKLLPWGATDEPEFKAAVAAMARHNRAVKEVEKRGMHIVRDPNELLLEAKLQRAASQPKPTPPSPDSIQVVRTGFEAESNRIESAFKKAVGAESMSHVNSGLEALAQLAAATQRPAPAERSDPLPMTDYQLPQEEELGTDPWANLRGRDE